MKKYIYAKGKIYKGLVRRREAEVALYLKNGGSTPIPIPIPIPTPTPTPTPTPSSNRKWLSQVTGYNKQDSYNGYAGIFGRSVTGLRVSGGKPYRVHIKGGNWLPPVTGNNENDLNNEFAGNAKGSPIDGVAISWRIYYAIHIKGGKWLPAVNGYNINDSRYGFAGIIGKVIDAVTINGRTYATSY